MRKETNLKQKRLSKAAKQRKKLIITGGLSIIALVLLIVFIVFIFKSCGVDYTDVDRNTVFVLKDGKIASSDVDSFDEKQYDKREFKSYVKELIRTYNKEIGNNSLKQKTLEIEDGKAILVLEYADAEVYEQVNGVELYTGTIKDAKEKGYQFEGYFAKLVDGKTVRANKDDFSKSGEYKVVIIKSNTKVVIPGEICFVSVDNVFEVGSDYVIIKEGCQLSTGDSENETESGTEGSDGSISEDELVSGEGTINFDFGEENIVESPYSDVLTYIIYK